MNRTASSALLMLALAATALAGPEEEIRSLLDRDMDRSARVRLEALLREAPGALSTQLLLAEFRIREEDYDAAEAAARKAVTIDPASADGWMLWGRARFEQGREAKKSGRSETYRLRLFEQAETGFRRAQALRPDDPDVLGRIGWAREWQGRHGPARQFYESQIRAFPDRPAGYRRLAALLAAEGKTAEALAEFDRGLAAAGDDAEMLYLKALLLLDLGRREEALASLRRSILADPDFERSWNRLRTLLDPEIDLPRLAVEALKTHPTSALAARWAAFHTLQAEPAPGEPPPARFERVLGWVLPALEVHGDDEELYKLAFRAAQALIGKTPRSAPNGKLAVKAFETIHQAYAWSGDAANNLGFFYREVKKYRLSLAWYLRAVERAPENQDILNDTGLIYLFHFPKEREKGLPYFLKTVALVTEGDQKPERGYWDALENLCKHYWEVDRQPEKVLEYARRRYLATKGVRPYNMSPVAKRYAEKARRALDR